MRPSRLALPCAAALLAAVPLAAQRAPSPAEVDRVFAAFDRPGSPGCALGVARDGRMLYEKGYGRAELEWEIPITPATVFNVGSVSKQFVAAAVALLAERGRLSLDDDVRKHVPELPDYGAPITIRHLLHHTSGIRDLLEVMSMGGRDINAHYRMEEYLDVLARQKALNFAPGSQHLYSNSGYLLLGEIVRRASGVSLRRFADREMFGPLGMKDTHFHDDHRMVIPRRAMAYAPAEGGGFQLAYATSFDRVGPGGINTTVRDMVRWDHALATGAIGGKGFLRTMLERGVLAGGDTIPYALALVHGERGGLRTVSHGGSSLGFRAFHLRFPEQRLAVVTLCNTPTDPGALAGRVADLYLAGVVKPAADGGAPPAMQHREEPEVPVGEEELRGWAGEYRSEEVRAGYEVALEGGRLVVRRFGHETVPLRPLGGGRFRASFGVLRFGRDATGVAEFRVDGGRARGILFRRVGAGTRE